VEHEEQLKLVLKRLEEAKVMLNKEKCEFVKSSVKFLGHIMMSVGSALTLRR